MTHPEIPEEAPKHDCIGDENYGCPACQAEGAPPRTWTVPAPAAALPHLRVQETRPECDCGYGSDSSQVNPLCPRHRPQNFNREQAAKVHRAHRLVMNNDQDEDACLCGEVFTPGFQYDEHAEHVADALLVAGLLPTPAPRPVVDREALRQDITDEISGIQVGSGYESVTIGITAAREAADAILALLPTEEPEVYVVHHHDIEKTAEHFNQGYDEAQRQRIGGPESRNWLTEKVWPLLKDHVDPENSHQVADHIADALLSEADLSDLPTEEDTKGEGS